jgi:hypothetical protein
MLFFDASYYINLDSRTDRKELFEKRMSETGYSAGSHVECIKKWRKFVIHE